MSFWMDATERIQRLRAQEFARERKESKQLFEAMDKLAPVIFSAIGGKHPIESASVKVEELVSDLELRRKVFEQYSEWLTVSPEKVEQNKEELARERSGIRRREKLHKARDTIHRGLMQLFEAAREGDADAAEELVDAATLAAVLVSSAENSLPDLFKTIARQKSHWPFLATHKAGWEKAAAHRIARLDLGEVMQVLHVRFRSVKGSDANLPARRWAKAAVRTIEEAKWRRVMIGGLIRDFGPGDAFADFYAHSGWEFGADPQWAKSVMELKPFSKESFKQWKPVVREVIRDQIADFHMRQEWETQRNTAAENGKTSKGELQNAILDDIVSALERVAPAVSC